jgi:hypothetical protein
MLILLKAWSNTTYGISAHVHNLPPFRTVQLCMEWFIRYCHWKFACVSQCRHIYIFNKERCFLLNCMSTPLYIFIVWCLLKHRNKFSFAISFHICLKYSSLSATVRKHEAPNIKPSELAQVILLLTYIWEVPGLILDWGIDYTDWGFSSFSQSLQMNEGDSTLK